MTDSSATSFSPINMTDFTLHQQKGTGASQGGIYLDQQGHKWLLKEPQWGNLKYGLREYIAAPVYQSFLGEYAPQVELIYNHDNYQMWVGSKFLNNFKTIHEYYDTGANRSDVAALDQFVKTVATIVFMGDLDAHTGNVGVVDENGKYTMAKIDHGYAFKNKDTVDVEYLKTTAVITGGNLKNVSIETVYDIVKYVINVDHQKIQEIIATQCDNIAKYAQRYDTIFTYDWHYYKTEFKYKHIDYLSKKLKEFQAIEKSLQIEMAIINNDVEAIKRLADEGVDLQKQLTPFYDRFDSSNMVKHKMSPKELALSYQHNHIADYLEATENKKSMMFSRAA